jgi:AraC-like DNA-binding protein
MRLRVLTKTNKKSAHTLVADDGLFVERFDTPEALNEFYAANGWQADYRQIEPGEIEITVMGRQVGDVEFFREKISRRIASSTKSPCEIFSMILSAGGLPGRVHGRELGMNDLLLAPPCSKLDIVPAAGCDMLTIQIPAARFDDYAAVLGAEESFNLKSQPTWYAGPATDVDGIRRLVLATLTPSAVLPEPEGIDWTLISTLIGTSNNQDMKKQNRDPYGRAEKHSIVRRARNYIHNNLGNDIRVDQLCQHCGVSLSTLGRLFHRELSIGPKDYILAARLTDVRRRLWGDSSCSQTIAVVAMDSGFTHMGRFSEQYRNHFGRLPSEDRDLRAQLIEKHRAK